MSTALRSSASTFIHWDTSLPVLFVATILAPGYVHTGLKYLRRARMVIRTIPARPVSAFDPLAETHSPAGFRENSVTSSSHFRESAGKPVAMFSHKKKVESSDTFRQRRHFLRTSTSSRKRQNFLQVLCSGRSCEISFEEQRDHQLAEAKSEILKQECKIDTLDTCIREFQRQAHSNRLEVDYVSCGYEESRREQARLHE